MDVGNRVKPLPKIVNCYAASVATVGTGALDLEAFSAMRAGVGEFLTGRSAAADMWRRNQWNLGAPSAEGMSYGRTAVTQFRMARADATEVSRGIVYGLAGSVPTDGVHRKALLDAVPGFATASMFDVAKEACR